ncbi:ester cyclase [Streptosporangiaceae bacterium NEAU-GS5]|nr:ester cyclase [Streptosporangiaceae bacterium NEAU-GS5]
MPGLAEHVHRFFEACNTHDLAVLARCYAPDVFLKTPGGQAEGRDEVLSVHQMIWDGIPDLCVTALQTIEEDDDVAAPSVMSGTHRGPLLLPGGDDVAATGRPVSFRSCWIFTMQEGLIVSHQLYWDQLELYVQLGLPLPEVPDDFQPDQA